MYTPFKMKGKSPMMKKLIGNQNRLPKELQEAIKAAPGKMKKESATKMKKASMTKMKKESMAKLKKSVAKLKKGKINPFSAEYKRMTESQRKRKYGADYKDRIKGKTKSDGKTKLKPINRKNISEALNKTKNRINELNKNIQAGADKLSKDLKSKKTIKITGNNNSSSSSSSSNGFTSRKGDPYLYKKNNDGTFTTKKGKDGKEVIVKKGSKAYDAISSVFKMKKAPAKMKKAAMKLKKKSATKMMKKSPAAMKKEAAMKMKKEAAMKMKKKSAMKMKKSMAKEKMKMVTVNGKKVPAFAADGKGANDMKKGSAATMNKKSMAKMKKAAMKMKKAPAKMMKKK